MAVPYPTHCGRLSENCLGGFKENMSIDIKGETYMSSGFFIFFSSLTKHK